ncbi:MAG: 6-phosphogluconolactonase [Thermoanaerobaculia bacterium]
MEKTVGGREVRVFDTPALLAAAAASEFLRAAREAIAGRGRFSTALSGGSTPRAAYEEIAGAGADLEWPKVAFFWSDERCVPLDDEASNFRAAKDSLLTRIPIPPENVHPWETYRPPAEAADAYENRLGLYFGIAIPEFDWVFLGLGADGHTASLFPGTQALTESRRAVAANFVTKLDAWRLTLTLPALNASRTCVFLVQGKDKADAVREILTGKGDLPAARVSARRTIWMLDRAAAPPRP